MSEYVLPHDVKGERERLALMSTLLDPTEQAHIERLGIRPGWRCLELGCGNGSISQFLARSVAPSGRVVATDLDISYLADLRAPCLETRRLDVLHDAIEEASYNLVVARALLHHLPSAHPALEKMVAALKPGGVLLSVEPDMLPATVAEPDCMRAYWKGWLKWSVEARIDFFIGRKIPSWLQSFGLTDVAGEEHSPLFNGGSDWARYWVATVRELRPSLLKSGFVTEPMIEEFQSRFEDSQYWTSVISFTSCWGRKPA